MMSYLRALVVLFTVTALTASAVQLDGYDVYEVPDSGGEPQKVDTVSAVDTSTFDTFEQYKSFIQSEITIGTKRYTQDWAVAGRPHPTLICPDFQAIINEMQDRGLASKGDVFSWNCFNVAAITNQLSSRDGNTERVNEIPSAVSQLEQTDPAQVTLRPEDGSLFELLQIHARAARVVVNHADSRKAFDNIWTVLENNLDTSAAEYEYNRAINYHAPLGNDQKAYDTVLSLARNGKQLGSVLSAAIDGQIDRTDELLEAVCRNGDSDTLSALDNELAEYWTNMNWFEIKAKHTDKEILRMCEKYEAVQRSTAPTFRGAVADTKADYME